MTYISDIFINLHRDYFEFYEWNKKDYIEHIKKIPVIKIDNKMMINIINYDTKIDDKIIKKYIQKCEKYNTTNHFNYLALTNGFKAIVILFDSKGNIFKKSSLIFEDEENICLLSNNMRITVINYEIKKKEKITKYTRFEKERIQYIIKNIKKMNKSSLKYLYFDCFNKQENNIDIIINKISSELKNDNIDVYNKSNNLFNLINK